MLIDFLYIKLYLNLPIIRQNEQAESLCQRFFILIKALIIRKPAINIGKYSRR